MAKDDRGPRVPDGPTVTGLAGPGAREPLDREPGNAGEESRATGDGARSGGPEDRRTGGRRPYDEILGENQMLQQRVRELGGALNPFAFIPIDETKPAPAAQYVLTKGAGSVTLTGEQIRAARTALGMP